MDEFDTALKYIFILSFILIIVAYYAGSQQVLSSLFSGSNSLLLTVTGRGSNGQFAAYPGGYTNTASGG